MDEVVQRFGDIFTRFFRDAPIPRESDRACVIVEPRPHRHLAFVLANARYYLPDWSLYIFHSIRNKAFVQTILEGVRDRKNIRCIPFRAGNMTVEQYNVLLTSASFWSRIQAEHVLIFQTDSFLVRRGLDRLLGYGYAFLGAPWPHIAAVRQAGNGGLSLRRRSWMLRCIEAGGRLPPTPEDVYFHTMLTHLGAPLATVAHATTVFVENIPYPQPFGYHQCEKIPFSLGVVRLYAEAEAEADGARSMPIVEDPI